MEQGKTTSPQQLQVPATLDVQAVESALNKLWMSDAGAQQKYEDDVLMRARVLNLMVYVASAQRLREVEAMLGKVTAAHPCRALIMLAETESADRDIEMFVSTQCLSSANKKHLCCEEVMLHARGRFSVELPSATTPLLASDLPVFLWWRDDPRLDDASFITLGRASDRVIIDSADSANPHDDLIALDALLKNVRRRVGAVSDLAWARLTPWRTLLAAFYDVAEYRAALNRITDVRIEYAASTLAPEQIAPKALMLAGWLASRLGWRVGTKQTGINESGGDQDAHIISMEKDGRSITLSFHKAEPGAGARGGRMVRVALSAQSEPSASFVVARSDDHAYLETSVTSGNADKHAGRVLLCEDESEAVLLGRELEILRHDRIYEQAVAAAAEMLAALSLASSNRTPSK